MPKPVQSAGVSLTISSAAGRWSRRTLRTTAPEQDFVGPHSAPSSDHCETRPKLYFALFNADGSPDLLTQYDFETRPASVWVQSAALQKHDMISDEWRIHFFGNLADESARPDADPDRDRVSNHHEYIAGTDPLDPSSAPRLEAALLDSTTGRVALRWLAVPGRRYTIEASPSVLQPDWTSVARDLTGTGLMHEFIQTSWRTGARFYRLRIRTEDQEDQAHATQKPMQDSQRL